MQQRKRGFLQLGKPGGFGCHANESMRQIQKCNTQNCNQGNCQDAQWGQWSQWEACPVSCGGAMTKRTRQVGVPADGCGKDLSGPNMETKICSKVVCEGDVDCKFGEWGGWGACSASCDGVMSNSRIILQSASGKGKPCAGPLKVYAPCNPMSNEAPPQACGGGLRQDCVFGEWTSSTCSRPCGGGVMHKTRHIVTPAKHLGRPCNGPVVEVHSCQRQACPGGLDCAYGAWNDWGACTRCGGRRTRFRHILHEALPGGKNCRMDAVEEVQSCSRRCHGPNGKMFCVWGEWASWGDCSVKCGNGRTYRRRKLVLSAHQQPPLQNTSYLEAFEALSIEIHSRKKNRMKDVTFAFLGGCLSFLTLGAAIRMCSRRRSTSTGPSYMQVDRQPELQ